MLQHIYSAIVYLRVLIKDQLPTRVGDICSELTDLVAERQKGTLLVTVITMLRDLQATTAPPPSPSPQPFPQVAHPSCPYLIFVIFFTRAKFLENKIYIEKRQFFALNL